MMWATIRAAICRIVCMWQAKLCNVWSLNADSHQQNVGIRINDRQTKGEEASERGWWRERRTHHFAQPSTWLKRFLSSSLPSQMNWLQTDCVSWEHHFYVSKLCCVSVSVAKIQPGTHSPAHQTKAWSSEKQPKNNSINQAVHDYCNQTVIVWWLRERAEKKDAPFVFTI